MLRICQINYPEAAFHGQAVKTVAYLRVSTPQQDVSSQRLAILGRGKVIPVSVLTRIMHQGPDPGRDTKASVW